MKNIIIAAIGLNNEIGLNNNLLWKLPNDMAFFKQQTLNQTVITGRKNYESIPEKFRPLKNRHNIVVTKQETYAAPGAIIVKSIPEAISKAKENKNQDCYIIGGGEIYAQTIEFVDEMYITHVDASFEADTYFPNIDKKDWQIKILKIQPIDQYHPYPFRVLHYIRK